MKSVFSHLASADRPDQDDATRRQVEAFDRAAAALRTVCPRIKTHLLNSSGLMRFPDAAGDYVRVGIALLGVVPASDMDLKPVVHFETAIASLHRIHPTKGSVTGWRMPPTMNASSPPCPLAMRTDTREASPMDAGTWWFEANVCPLSARCAWT